MKRKPIWNFVYGLILLLTICAEVLAVLAVKRMNMLPDLYMGAFIAMLAVFALIIGLLLFCKGKKSGKIRRIFAILLAFLLIGGCMVLRTVALDVVETLQMTTTDTLEITTREIYVLAEDPAADVKDAGEYTFGYIKDYDVDCTGQVLDELQVQTGKEIATAGFTDIVAMMEALFDRKVDSVILNGGVIEMLEELEGFADISTKIKVLAQIRVFETNAASAVIPERETNDSIPEETVVAFETETEPEEEKSDYSNLKPFAVYISGSDSRDKKIIMKSRSDVNILAVINPQTKQVLLINTPRDYYIPNTAGGNSLDKLTHCGIYGIECSMNTLAQLYEMEIDYFAKINFTGFEKVIDALGGVTVYSEYEFSNNIIDIKKGKNELNGYQALDFARERKKVPYGDIDRGRNQMRVIEAVIDKATSSTVLISNYAEILESIEGMFETSIPAELISSLMKMQLSEMTGWNVVSYSTTGGGGQAMCYSMPGVNASVVFPNYDTVDKAKYMMDMVMNGELLTQEVVNSII